MNRNPNSRVDWFQAAAPREGPTKRCLSCKGAFHNKPGEDYRCCRECRRGHRPLPGAFSRPAARRAPSE